MATGLKWFPFNFLDWFILPAAVVCFGSLAHAGTLPPAPLGVAASDGTFTNKVRVSWAPVEGASAYAVWRATNNSLTAAVRLGLVTNTVYDDTTAVAGVNYYYWVRARNDTGASGFDAPDTGYRLAPPAKPAGVAASDGTLTDKVQVSWRAVSGATHYEVLRRPNGSTANAPPVGTTAETVFEDTTTTAGVVYGYWVRAWNAAGHGAAGAPDTGYRLAPPAPPVDLAASDGAFTNMVLVSWRVRSGATAYEVWRNGVKDTNSATSLGEVSGTTLADTNAEEGKLYYYWVRARNAAGFGGWSTNTTGYQAVRIPPAPLEVAASDGTFTNKVRVSWAPAERANAYAVWRATTTNSSLTAAVRLGLVSNTVYDDTTAAAGVNYYYWVRARNDTGASGFDAPDTGYRLAPPAKPAGVAASDGTLTDMVRVSWSPVSGAAYYEVLRRPNGSTANAPPVGTAAETVFEDATAAAGVVYSYWVRAWNAAGHGVAGTPDTGFAWMPTETLNNAAPISGLSGGAGRCQFFSLHVPDGQQVLQVTTAGGTGNCELYLTFATWPQTNSYDARSMRAANTERVQVLHPASGTWYVLLYGRGAFSGVTLQAAYYPSTVDSVAFAEQAAGQTYGYDNFSYDWPWKSLEFVAGGSTSDPVQVEVLPDSRAFSLVEMLSSGGSIAGADAFQAAYNVYGYPTLTLPLHSSGQRGSARIIARFNNIDKAYCLVATYPRWQRTVAVTLVHEQHYRATDIPDAEVQAQLSRIYMQAVIECVLVRRPARTVAFDKDQDGRLDVSDWMTPEMQAIRNACKSDADYDIFIVSKPSDYTTTGFMNFNQKYGFVFGDLGNARTVAHELGHGMAGLLHTPHDLDNIMYDYESNSKWRLRKGQWDQLNP